MGRQAIESTVAVFAGILPPQANAEATAPVEYIRFSVCSDPSRAGWPKLLLLPAKDLHTLQPGGIRRLLQVAATHCAATCIGQLRKLFVIARITPFPQ
jgi:hypothetical protein